MYPLQWKLFLWYQEQFFWCLMIDGLDLLKQGVDELIKEGEKGGVVEWHLI